MEPLIMKMAMKPIIRTIVKSANKEEK